MKHRVKCFNTKQGKSSLLEKNVLDGDHKP